MKKSNSTKWIVFGLLALVAILLVASKFINKDKKKGTEVFSTIVTPRTIFETVGASGKIFPKKEVKISSDVSGEVVELYIMEGDSVKKGQLLARINPDAYESAVERGKAAVNNSKAQWANSKAQIERSIAQKEQIQAQLANTRLIHDRNVKLFDEKVISQADFDNSLSQLQALEANLRSAKATIASSKEMANASQFSVKSAEASLKELKTNLQKTTIYAPMSGIISSLNVEKGERVVGTIQMAGTELMRIANMNIMEVQVEVSETDILRVHLGDKVDIEVDAYLDEKFTGVVEEIASSANNISTSYSLNSDQVPNFIVKINIDRASYMDLDNAQKFPFRPGMSASVDIKTAKKENVLSVPIQCITAREEKTKDKDLKKIEKTTKTKDIKEVVFKILEGKVEKVEVKSGIQDDKFIEVISGLNKGDEIVAGPYSEISKKLKDGKKVSVVDEEDFYKKKEE